MRKFLQEFKEFALRGNVINLAVGLMVGAAFQSVVTSLTTDILSPIIGLFASQNFDQLSFTIRKGVSLQYGAFITAVVNFFIMAFVVFILVKIMNKALTLSTKKNEEQPAPPPRQCPYCMTTVHEEATRCPSCTSELSSDR